MPSVEVSFGQGSYRVDEGSTVTVKVKLSADPERTVTIPITTATDQGTRPPPDDYSGVSANVTFNSGDTEKSFTVEAAQDTVDDDGESVKLTFGSSLPTGVTKGSTNEAVVSITDDDVPSVEVSFGQGSYRVDEGSTVTVKVKLSADPERTVTIPITKANQGTTSPGDYSGVPANVTFNSGDTEKSFTVEAAQDTVDDDGESVKLTFGSSLPTGVTKGSTNEAVVSITDDDVPSVEVSFGQGSYRVDEGSTVTVKVKLSADPERTVTIPITATDQDEASGDDYSGVPPSVTFVSGDTEETISFTAASDNVDDDGESVKLTFGALPDGVTKGSTNEAIVSITDDDVPSVEVSFGHQRGYRKHHRRRRAVGGGELRAVLLQGGRGKHRHRQGEAERRPRTHRHHPHHQGQPGHYLPRRLFRRARQRHLQQRRYGEELQQRRYGEELHLLRSLRHGRTTMGRA